MTASTLHWRRKLHALLHALLHDSPDKATDLRDHEHRAALIKAIFQFEISEEFDKSSDWNSSAADRLPFPSPSKLTQSLEEILKFPHPLGGAAYLIPTVSNLQPRL